jgi:hypothetical protein
MASSGVPAAPAIKARGGRRCKHPLALQQATPQERNPAPGRRGRAPEACGGGGGDCDAPSGGDAAMADARDFVGAAEPSAAAWQQAYDAATGHYYYFNEALQVLSV